MDGPPILSFNKPLAVSAMPWKLTQCWMAMPMLAIFLGPVQTPGKSGTRRVAPARRGERSTTTRSAHAPTRTAPRSERPCTAAGTAVSLRTASSSVSTSGTHSLSSRVG